MKIDPAASRSSGVHAGFEVSIGGSSVRTILLTDETPMLTSNPAWTPEEGEAAGSILTPASLWETANARVVQTLRQPSALSSNTV